ncbi:hypothetical protein M0R45_007973 [Rubus argutus]|uniref:TIR domain-containing protein n=1 Tax=Rubus argutus TaxID=59490 RepID=A0AAW1Y2R7_RUBAR
MSTHLGASSSSSSSHIPSYTYEYDVFLSFRGVDTRYSFTRNLYSALDKKGITTFMDNQLESGEEISRQLLETIERSKIAIIVFSENFASSRMCLDELVKILECKNSGKQIVRPVFYKVKPKDVRPQGTYGKALAKHQERFTKAHNEALAKHEERFKNSHKEKVDLTNHKRSYDEAFGGLESTFQQNMDKLVNWGRSLTEAAGLSGWEYSTGYESNFIDMIVEMISKREMLEKNQRNLEA